MITIPGAAAGDITRVIAGDGLSGGATDGDATLTLDLNELTAAVLADGDFITFIDTNDSNGSRKEALADVLDLIAGVVATTGLDRSGATLVLTDLHPVGVDGSANQLLTDDGDGTVTSEANITFTSNVLTVGASADIEPQIILQNDENSLQIGVANATDDMITGSADGDVVINSVGDHKVLIAQNDTLAITLDADGDVTFANNIDGGTWLGTTIAVNKGGTGGTDLTYLITMGSHTTGDFVGTITGGTGITSTGGTTGEDVDHTLSLTNGLIADGSSITSLGTQAANFVVGNTYGVIIGDATQETVSIGDGATDLVPELQVLGTTAADSSILLAAFSTTATTAGSPILAFAKGGNATLGSHTVVTDGEELGNIIAFGDDGTDLETPAASIQFEVDGTPGSGDMPGRIIIGTTADGATAVTEAVRIDSSQNVTFAQGIIVEPAASAADDGIANTTGTGLVATMRALTGIAVGELVHIDANGDLDEAHADATADMPAIGIALTANSSGSDANIQVLLQGFYRDDSQFSFGTIGAPVYTDHSTEGDFTLTPSTTDGHFIQRVGISVTDDMIYFNPSLDVIERD